MNTPTLNSKPTLITPPALFEGAISELVDLVVTPAFPSADVLVAWTEAILAYYTAPDPICIVRGHRKGELRKEGGTRVVDSDNAPGIWSYLRALDGAFVPADLASALSLGSVPVLAMLKGRDKRDWDWNYATRALRPGDSGQLWDRQLKHCHILPVLQEKGLSLRQRAMRNITPTNHFVFPNGSKHFVMERVGWSEHPATADLGESGRVIAWIQQRLIEHLGLTGTKVYDRFLQEAGGSRPTHAIPDGQVRFRLRIAPRELPASSVARTGNSRQQAETYGGGTTRRWTMNANLDYYIKTRETAPLINLSLSYQRSDGQVESVGRFVIDLVDLANRAVVTRRGPIFDLKLECEGGQFWIGVRRTQRLPLMDFAA